MWKYCGKKIIETLIIMLLISFFSFAIIYIAPGDISSMYITSDMSEKEREAVLEKLGANQSLPEQYAGWMGNALHGDLGVSLSNKSSVAPQLARRLLIAIPLGLWAGYKKNGIVDNLISFLSYIGMSIPSFWLGMLLIILFTAELGILPSGGIHTVGNESVTDTIKHLIMPSITLSLGSVATFIRYIRANTISQLAEEYVLTAEAKGTSAFNILRKHVLKNTLLPIITLMGMNLASLVCGSFIIESVFGWPGIGMFAMSAIGQRDYPVIMAYIMLSGFILVSGNLLADILYAFADPRIKRGIDKANGK